MKIAICLAMILPLAACGVETASTAATAAALKKQEIEQGQKTLQQFQQKLDQVNQQAQQRTEQAAESGR
jgi:NifU-like protein involved in Fe-S cluster formation